MRSGRGVHEQLPEHVRGLVGTLHHLAPERAEPPPGSMPGSCSPLWSAAGRARSSPTARSSPRAECRCRGSPRASTRRARSGGPRSAHRNSTTAAPRGSRRGWTRSSRTTGDRPRRGASARRARSRRRRASRAPAPPSSCPSRPDGIAATSAADETQRAEHRLAVRLRCSRAIVETGLLSVPRRARTSRAC